MLKFQKGNCFECSTLLTSLLLGQGYNAFVVSGYASREQTLCDTSRIPCPYLIKEDPPPVEAQRVDTSKYKLKPPPDFRSQFEIELELNEEKKIEEKTQKQIEDELEMIEEFERPTYDEYRGFRIHSWVLILPEKKVAREEDIFEPTFIEPSTGVSSKPSDPETSQLYFGVESVWNDENYWVNMQPFSDGCEDISWDFSKVELWEHLLVGEPWTMRGTADDEEDSILEEKHLDMPFSYVKDIKITERDFEKRYPNGRKTIFYKKTKIDLYAAYILNDGMVQKITIYEDDDYSVPIEIREKYAYRYDNLIESKKDLTTDSVIDYYKRGRPDHCKEHQYFDNIAHGTVHSERTLQFFKNVRFDGLSQIEMHPTYMTQHYDDRDDFLYYRHVQFSPEKSIIVLADIHCRYIWKIVEKYHRDERIIPKKNIAIREFAIGENDINLKYHYNPGQCARSMRSYVKPPLAERGDRLVLNPLMTHGFNPNPLDPLDRSLDLFYELEKQLNEEDKSISHVRAAETEISNFLKIRSREFSHPKLIVSPYDRHRGLESQMEMSEMEEKRARSQRETFEEVDYLKPYLARTGNPETLSDLDAFLLQRDCLNDYKQSQVRRANNILRQFEECTEELEKTQILLTTQGEDLTRESEEKILDRINELSFLLHTLEIRLNRHKELVLVRYKTLLRNLQQNQFLVALTKRNYD